MQGCKGEGRCKGGVEVNLLVLFFYWTVIFCHSPWDMQTENSN